jgi:hypothetical protein
MKKNWWWRWTVERPAAFGDWLWLVLVVQPANFLRMRLLTSRLIPWVLGLQALRTILQALSHPTVNWRAPIIFWTTLFMGVMLLRYWYRRRREKSSKDVAGIFE